MSGLPMTEMELRAEGYRNLGCANIMDANRRSEILERFAEEGYREGRSEFRCYHVYISDKLKEYYTVDTSD